MTYDEALRKALACLKLANNNANEHEAALAASKAQKLIDDYKLDVSAADYESETAQQDNEPIAEFGNEDPVDSVRNWQARWAANLLSAICRQNACRMFSMPAVTSSGDGRKNFGILGRASDVATCRYLYSYLKNEVLRLARVNCKGHSGTYERHYCLGVVDTIRMLLHKQREATFAGKRDSVGANPMALIKVNNAIARLDQRDKAVVNYMNDLLENGGWSRGRASAETQQYTGGRAAGQRDGHQVRLTSAKGGLTAGHKSIGN